MSRNGRRVTEDQPQLPLGVEAAAAPASGTAPADVPLDWRLDEQTCRVGRAGVAAARAALAADTRRRGPAGRDGRGHPGGDAGTVAGAEAA